MLTKDIWLPTEEELTVQEVPLGTPSLRAGAMHLGKACEVQNNEFMLCRGETQDPRFYKIILNITFHFNSIPFLHIEAVNFASAVCHIFSFQRYNRQYRTRSTRINFFLLIKYFQFYCVLGSV